MATPVFLYLVFVARPEKARAERAQRCAIRAGYSAKSARVVGCQNITKTNIAAAIEKARAERAQRCALTADWVLEELRKIAGAQQGDMSPGQEGDRQGHPLKGCPLVPLSEH